MADTNRNLQIIIELQAKAAEQELTNITSALAALGKVGQRTSVATKGVAQSLLDASKKVAGANVNIQRTIYDFAELQKRTQTTTFAIKNFGVEIARSAQQYLKNFQARVRNVLSVFAPLGNAFKNVVSRIRAYNAELRKSADAQKKSSIAGQLLRRTLIALGGALIIRNALSELAKFGQSMSTVRALTKATEGEMEALTNRAKQLGSTTRFSATQVASGLEQFARSGLSIDKQIAVVDDALTLAQAGALELGRAAELTAISMKVFEVEAKDARRIVDTLAKAANSALTDVNQLGDALTFAAPAAKAANVSFNQTVAALSALADAGQQGTLGGTALRSVIVKLSKPTQEAKELFARLNIDFKQVNIETQGLIPVLELLSSKTIGVAEAATIAGQRGGTGLLNLIRAFELIKSRTKILDEAAGEAKRIADVMDQNLNGATLRLKAAWNGLVLSIGDANKGGGELLNLLGVITQAFRDAQTEGTSLSELLSTGFRAAAFGAALIVDGVRGLELVIQVLRGAWALFAEQAVKAWTRIQQGILLGRIAFSKLIELFFKLGTVWEKVVNGVKTKLSDMLITVRETLAKINGAFDSVVPDKLLSSLAKVELSLVKGQLAQRTFAEETVKAQKKRTEALAKEVLALEKRQTSGEKFWKAEQSASADRIIALAQEESAVDKLTNSIIVSSNRRLKAAEDDAKKLPEVLRKMREASDKEAANVTPITDNVGTTPEGDLARIQKRKETLALLKQIELASISDINDQLAKADVFATKEAILRAQERQAKLAIQLNSGLINQATYEEKRKQIIEAKENEIAEVRKAAQGRVLEATTQSLEGAASAFGTFYELSGKQAKEFLIAQRAVSSALTLIKTYEAAQSAYAAGTATGVPGLGAIMAALAVAEGLARVAIINSQGLAGGGEVLGHSPTSTADNIPARLTAGEFVQPVKTVQYYGAGIMEALRTQSIPRSVLAGYQVPTRPPSSRFAFQSGGAIRGTGSQSAAPGVGGGDTVIANYTGTESMERFFRSRPGRRVLLNVIEEDSFQIKRILGQ